jgi:hypothetical protein
MAQTSWSGSIDEVSETLAWVCSAFPEHRGMRVLKEKCDKIRGKI